MAQRQIRSVGTYLPLLRLERKAAATALAWSGLGGPRSGRRSVATWDEDALTMAVEAGRSALAGADSADIRAVTFASTSAPFTERLHAGITIEALRLPPSTEGLDVAGSRRCAVSALARALKSTPGGDELIISGERRATEPGNSLQLAWGDGAAAAVVSDDGIARLLGHASISADIVDIYSSKSHPTPYASEERFVRDETVSSILIPAISKACSQAGIEPKDIDLAVVCEPVQGTFKAAAAKLKIGARNVCETVQQQAGDLGAALPLFGLANALEQSQPSHKILLVGFGSGCDALILEVTGTAPGSNASNSLGKGASLTNYTRFLSLVGSLDLDWGPRSELEQKTAASVLARHGRDMHGFVGGRDSSGNVQFPKTLIPVSPATSGPEVLIDVGLSELTARVVSLTADRLNFTPDPPFYFGLVQFENGARVSMELCDVEGTSISVGDHVAMAFRVKSIDRRRGFRTYFWKARPLERATLEGF
jgi:3-hydroxy-3-methylglutaryl CoA synthase/uncharacterized OB-fold protein